MVKVPQLVPVEKARKTDTTKTIKGTYICSCPAVDSTTPWIKSAAPKSPVMPERFQERIRMIIGAHMLRKPAAKEPINSLKGITPRLIYSHRVTSVASRLPITRPRAESAFAKASIRFSPAKRPPV